MRDALLLWLVVACAQGCAWRAVDLEGRPCDGEACAPGYICHPERQVCAPKIAIGCTGRLGEICARDLDDGDPCPAAYAFIPCSVEVDDCQVGCRTCGGGLRWSACSTGTCTGSTCPCVTSHRAVEICDGEDNDCNDTVDDAVPTVVNADCAERHASAVSVVAWECDAGACAIAACEDAWSNTNGRVADGCEDTCVPTMPPTEVCDGQDNDCNGAVDDSASDCTTYYQDADSDTFGAAGTARCLCAPEGDHTVTNANDCDDNAPSCTTSCVDTDTDGVFDCDDPCVDPDGDGFGAGPGCSGTDCDETSTACTSTCVDTDGDGVHDCKDTCVDVDLDGYGAGPDCAGADCDDNPAACGANCQPGAIEYCDGLDNDCSGAPDNGCITFTPSNLGTAGLCVNTAPLVLSGNVIINTRDPSIGGVSATHTAIVDQTSAGESDIEIAVFFFDRITIEDTAVVTVVGSRALALVACTNVTVSGELDLCAGRDDGIVDRHIAGPGGWQGGGVQVDGVGPGGGRLGNGTDTYPLREAGGGGGAHCGSGGGGGSARSDTYTDILGGDGGTPYGEQTLIPLRGGSGGGGGGSATSRGRTGGGGGGAVQIAANGTIRVDGTISACGRGGGGNPGVGHTGGGGGGAGGAILLEADTVIVSGILAANGGGGGGGDYGSSFVDDTSGADGQASTARADGGTHEGTYASDGGLGGAGDAPNGDSADDVVYDSSVAGGGGGAAGVIRINTRQGNPPSITGTYSPTHASCATFGDIATQ